MVKYRINRNIVECKGDCNSQRNGSDSTVLIETSWNVKHTKEEIDRVKKLVLIETSWNVKCECISFFYLIHSINRNIVECKVLKVYTTYIRILRINRNIVECKVCKIIRRIHFWILY